jgi:hypothetical protein
MHGVWTGRWDWARQSRKASPLHGHADTLEEAKAIIERGWQEWLSVAGLNENDEAPK